MTISASSFKTATRLIPAIAALVLAGCQTPVPRVAVYSSYPPFFGSAPISAYDEYALALRPKVGTPRAERAILLSLVEQAQQAPASASN